MSLLNTEPSRNILLINSPAYDTRLPWAAWHQPVGLLQIGAWLHAIGHDVKFIDCLQIPSNNRLPKQKQKTITIDNTRIDFWRIGLAPDKVMGRILAWQKDSWLPDTILISTGMTFWWEATRELIQVIKSHLDVPVYLGGAYPTYYYEHALHYSGADVVVQGDVPEVVGFHSDLSIYGKKIPNFAAIHIVSSTLKDIVEDIQLNNQLGIRTFTLYDDYFGYEHREMLEESLASILELGLPGLRFILPGNLSPRLVTERIATYFKKLNFQQIFLHDDVSHSPNHLEYRSNLSDYQHAVQLLHNAGFEPRTNEIGAAVLIGLPQENLSELTQRIVKLASIIGSVHLVPYQFTPGTPEGRQYEGWLAQRDGKYDIANLNGRLFPLARLAGKRFDDYLELTRLVALLNSKFHSRTFDFLSDSLTANMVRKGLSEELWDPFKTSGELAEPVQLNMVENDN